VTLSLGHGVELPYAHPAVAGVRALAGVLAPRGQWSERDLARLTRQFVTRAAEPLYLAARFDADDRWHLPLALTDEVEVWLLTWTPWQGTGSHDHGGAAGAYTVLHGELTETWADRRGRTKRTVRPAGSSTSYGPDRVHSVQNRGTLEAISVHAYSPPRLAEPGLT
jgi:predicted metal-dependent enzyme (double-stranded beta helix superfamily)